MRTKMKSIVKNNKIDPKKVWSSTVQLIILSLVLLLSQLTLAKDRIQYHVQNFDGSTLKVINEQGVVSQSYQYAPFGQQLQYKKPSNLKNPNAFVGGIQDANDLVYLKQRHYNPVLGRFYQPDPITFLSGGHGQTNRYQYGWNDSYTFSDPSGLATKNGVSDTKTEQFMYDWWPGYKFGTGLYNTFSEGTNQFSFWEGFDVVSVIGSWGLKGASFVGGVADDSVRGLSKFGGSFIDEYNAVGGKVYTSTGTITQKDFSTYVMSGLYSGDVHILTGVHGLPDGKMIIDKSLYLADVNEFGKHAGVFIHDVPKLTPTQIKEIMNNSKGTVIGGFCNSNVCLNKIVNGK